MSVDLLDPILRVGTLKCCLHLPPSKTNGRHAYGSVEVKSQSASQTRLARQGSLGIRRQGVSWLAQHMLVLAQDDSESAARGQLADRRSLRDTNVLAVRANFLELVLCVRRPLYEQPRPTSNHDCAPAIRVLIG